MPRPTTDDGAPDDGAPSAVTLAGVAAGGRRLRRTPPSWSAPLVDDVFDALGGQVRLVGGCVRDAALERDDADLDMATPVPARDVLARLGGAGIKTVPTGLAHGTVTAFGAGTRIEVTTLRVDVATDGRHATVAPTRDWWVDAARRDFTINALSATRSGVLFDYFDGLDDLARGRVRFIGDPSARLAEDRLRAVRFFRFHAGYGRFPPDDGAMAAIAATAPSLSSLSAERLWGELKRLLALSDPVEACRLMARSAVDRGAFGAGFDAGRLGRLLALPCARLDRGREVLVRLAALIGPGATAAFGQRLRLSGRERAFLAELADPAPNRPPFAELYRRGRDAAIGRYRLALDAAGAADAATLPAPHFPVRGADLLAAGFAPGPELGVGLAALEQAWLAAEGGLDRELLLARITPPGSGRR